MKRRTFLKFALAGVAAAVLPLKMLKANPNPYPTIEEMLKGPKRVGTVFINSTGGTIYDYRIYDRLLTHKELIEMRDDPWGMYNIESYSIRVCTM